jgi:outer membrane protein assembly factor BamB
MKFNSFSRRIGSRAVFCGTAILACGVAACSSSSTDKTKESTTTDGGGKGTGGGGSTTTASKDWTMIGYDPQSTFFNPSETKLSVSNVANLTETWSHDYGGIGPSGTSCVLPDKIVTVTGNAIVVLDPVTGDELWRKDSPDITIGASGSGACEDGKLYLLNGTGALFLALDLNNKGEIVWQTDLQDPDLAGWSSTVIAGDLVLVGGSSGLEALPPGADVKFRGSVIALNKKTGKLAWQTFMAGDNENGASVWAAPSVDVAGGLVFAPTGNNYTKAGPGSDSVFALDLATGTEKWRHQARENDVFTIFKSNGNPDHDFGGNPTVYDFKGKKLVAAGQKSGQMYVFDRVTGDLLKMRDFGGASSMPGGFFQALAFDGKELVTVCNLAKSEGPGSEPSNGLSKGTTTSALFALDPLTLDVIWERQLGAYVWGPLTIANGVGYVGIETEMQAFNVSTGEKLFSTTVGGTITGAITVSDGRLFFQSGMSFLGSGHPDSHFHAMTVQ